LPAHLSGSAVSRPLSARCSFAAISAIAISVRRTIVCTANADRALRHGESSLTDALETTANIQGFIMHNMGLKPAQAGIWP
jgi:hypothetical protein